MVSSRRLGLGRQIQMTNLDRKVHKKTIRIQFQLKTRPKSIQLPQLKKPITLIAGSIFPASELKRIRRMEVNPSQPLLGRFRSLGLRLDRQTGLQQRGRRESEGQNVKRKRDRILDILEVQVTFLLTPSDVFGLEKR